MGIDTGAALVYGFRYDDYDNDDIVWHNIQKNVKLFETDLVSGEGLKFIILNGIGFYSDLDFNDVTVVELPTDPMVYRKWDDIILSFCEDHDIVFKQPQWLLVATMS